MLEVAVTAGEGGGDAVSVEDSAEVLPGDAEDGSIAGDVVERGVARGLDFWLYRPLLAAYF